MYGCNTPKKPNHFKVENSIIKNKEFSNETIKIPKYTDTQIVNILKQNRSGISVADLCREHGMSQATFYKWRSKYGDAEVSNGSAIKRA